MSKFPKGIAAILVGFVLLLVLFFLNFSFSEVSEVQVEATLESAESLKAKLAGLPMMVGAELGIAEAPCYQVRPGCEFWADRGEGGFPSDYQFSEQEEFCMFNGCLSWEPVPSVLEFTGEEITSLLKEVLTSNAPFGDPRILFEGGLIKASAVVKKPAEGVLYVEGYLTRRDEFSISFDLKRAQFNNVVLKGVALTFAGAEVNRYFNSQLSHLAGFRIDKLEISDSKLRFVGVFPSPSEELRIL